MKDLETLILRNDAPPRFSKKEFLKHRGAFNPESLGHRELEHQLRQLHALHPIASMSIEKGRVEFIFKEAVSWPFFLRLSISKPSWPHADSLTYRLGMRRVAGFSLNNQSMDIYLQPV